MDEHQEYEALYGPLDGGLDLDSEHAVDYDDRDFRGARATTSEDVVDLRDWGVRQKRGHTWNNRISSIRVH